MKFEIDLEQVLNSDKIKNILSLPISIKRIKQEYDYIISNSFPTKTADYDTVKDTFSLACNNMDKNRMNNYSYDKYAIKVSSGYLNGCYVFDKFILTQAPMDNTLDDFWLCIIENKVDTIINITQDIENYLIDYLNYDNVIIRGKNIKYYNQEIEYLRIDNWIDDSLPSYDDINKIIEAIEKSNKVLIHCWAGIGRSATSIILYKIYEAIKLNTFTNDTIFELVMILRTMRIKALNYNQYYFLYEYTGLISNII